MGKNDIISIDKVEYQKWLQTLCDEIDRQRLKAVMQLNASTLQHYWWLGNDILKKQQAQGWGAKVIDMLSTDLLKRYGNDSGYSIRNLKYMRQFAVEYPDFPFVQVPLAQLQDNQVLKSRLSKFTVTADGEFVQVPLAQITWYHHISMFPKVKDNILRAFYITESALQGWSRDIMLMQIEDGYHKKVKSLPNNFANTLPPLKSDLAKAAFKDPYNFGFVDMTKVKQETDLEDQLTTKVTKVSHLENPFIQRLSQRVCASLTLVKILCLWAFLLFELFKNPLFIGFLNKWETLVKLQIFCWNLEQDSPSLEGSSH